MDVDLKIKASAILEGSIFTFDIARYEIITDYIIMAVFSPGLEYTKHQHSFYEFHYIYDGNGEVGIEDATFHLEKGDFYITSPNVVHWQIASQINPMVEYCIRYQINEKEKKKSEEKAVASEMEALLYVLNHKTSYVVKDQNNLDQAFHKIFHEVLNRQLGYHQVIVNYITDILYLATRNFSDDNSQYEVNKRTINAIRCERLSTYIYDNIHSKLTYEDVAKHMCMSERHLTRIVKEERGMTLYQLILELRMKKVDYYLQNTNLRLKDMAELTGFYSEYHLSRTVKKYRGKNPSEMRMKSEAVNPHS